MNTTQQAHMYDAWKSASDYVRDNGTIEPDKLSIFINFIYSMV